MANESLASFSPSSGFSESNGNPTGGEGQPFSLTRVSTAGFCGASFGPKVTGTMLFLVRVPNAVALATGLTYNLTVCDDVGVPPSPGNPPTAGGLKTYWGVTVGPVVSGTSTPDESVLASCTEDAAQVTHATTPGNIVVAEFSGVVAHMGGLAAGNLALIRLRRLGGNALDTHNGRAILLRFDVRNT